MPPAIGRDAISALMARYPAGLKLDWIPEEAVVAASGDLGFTWGHFTTTSHDSTGKLVTEHGDPQCRRDEGECTDPRGTPFQAHDRPRR